jgi:hypothetical protein
MNDGRRRKCSNTLRYTLCRTLGNERHNDKLQSNQGTRSRADNYIEVFPSGERCHVID